MQCATCANVAALALANAETGTVEARRTRTPNGGLDDFARVYAVACGKIDASRREYADRAMECLHKAVNAGFRDAAHMKKDTDLDPLRERPDFKKILADIGAKAAPKQEQAPLPRVVRP